MSGVIMNSLIHGKIKPMLNEYPRSTLKPNIMRGGTHKLIN